MVGYNHIFAGSSTSLPQSGRVDPDPEVGHSSISKRAIQQPTETSDGEDVDSEGKRHLKRLKMHHYTGPPSEVFTGRRTSQETVSPHLLAGDGVDTTEHGGERLSSSVTPRPSQPAPATQQGPPPGRTKKQQRSLDRQAVKKYVTNEIEMSGHKFAQWDSAQRWRFIQDKRQDKLRKREQEGKGSLRMWFPFEGDEELELALLRKQFPSHLSENIVGNPSHANGSRHDHEDEDDEEMIVKREGQEGEEEEYMRRQAAYVNNDYGIVPRRAAAAKNEGRLREPSTPSSNEAGYAPSRRATSQDDCFGNGHPVKTEDGPIAFITRESATIPEVVEPEWRQYWETGAEGHSMLITPRIFRWNEKCQLVEWPPLDQVLPPLEPRPDQPVTEERKKERADSVLGLWSV